MPIGPLAEFEKITGDIPITLQHLKPIQQVIDHARANRLRVEVAKGTKAVLSKTASGAGSI